MFAHVSRLVRLAAAPALLASLLVTASACKGYNPLNPSDFGIQATDIVAGSGTQLRQGRGATVNYTLWLHDETKPEGKGTQLQSFNNFSFLLGYGQVIAGWDIGMDGMKVGGTRRLVIPPDYAYGAAGQGDDIPGNATLVFDIQLVGVY
jgi:FKBP-type peptidyl-prolyl cis-trans isomerase FkpA